MFLTDVISQLGSFIDDIPGVYVPQDDLESTITKLASNTVFTASVILIVLTIIAVLFSEKIPKLKMPLFVLMALTMAGSTLTLIGSTVYLNVNSESGGPIHWHADFEVWACGNELEFRDPTGALSNKIGTSVLHEHNDHRIHLEGVAVEKEVDASLGKFMHVSGGAITDSAMVIPLNDEGEIFEDEVDGDGPSNVNASQIDPFLIDDEELGKVAYFTDGQMCGNEVSDVQVFVYNYDGETKTYQQRKLDNPRDYVIFEDPNVPPGDCIIFEFGPTRDQTDKLCEQYGVRDIDRCEQFGVEPNQREICELTQVNYEPETSSDLEDVMTTMPADEEYTSGSDTDMEVSPALELLEAHPCSPYFDYDGNRNDVEVTTFNDEGNLINTDTDCDDYLAELEKVQQESVVIEEAN